MRKGLLLYNPAAGRYPIRRFVRGIIRPLKAAGWSMEIAETLSGTHATQTAHQAAAEKYDAVFAIGGDGTVGQVASGLLDSETALAVLPSGTSNVWALEQGQKPFSWFHWWALRENAALLANVEPQRVDVGMCNDQPFLLWAGIGLDAQAIHKIEPRHRFFKHISVPHYFATTVWEATFWHGLDLHVWADGEVVEGHFLVAVATNIRHYAGGMSVLSPQALLDDNEMDMWLLSGNSVADALRHFFDLVCRSSPHIRAGALFTISPCARRIRCGILHSSGRRPRVRRSLCRHHHQASWIENSHARQRFIFIEKQETGKWT